PALGAQVAERGPGLARPGPGGEELARVRAEGQAVGVLLALLRARLALHVPQVDAAGAAQGDLLAVGAPGDAPDVLVVPLEGPRHATLKVPDNGAVVGARDHVFAVGVEGHVPGLAARPGHLPGHGALLHVPDPQRHTRPGLRQPFAVAGEVQRDAG